MKTIKFPRLCLAGVLGLLIVVLTFGQASAMGGYGGSEQKGCQCGGGCGGGSGGSTTPLSEYEVNALHDAILEEYLARATYQTAISVLGSFNPMSMIVNSEQMHINALANLHSKYKLQKPADTWSGNIDPTQFTSRQEACRIGAEAETSNANFYYAHINSGQITHSDILNVFQNLGDASRYHHLPAFENYAGM